MAAKPDVDAFLARHAVFTLTRTARLPCLVDWIAGATVRGSWWAHPKGGAIFAAASALEDRDDVLVTKWVDGKVTFIRRDLWPALYRVVSDSAQHTSLRASLGAAARTLWDRVEADGALRFDVVRAECATPAARRALSRARTELERACAIVVASEHTESGRHEVTLRSWKKWAPRAVVAAAGKLSLDTAREQLERAGLPTEVQRKPRSKIS